MGHQCSEKSRIGTLKSQLAAKGVDYKQLLLRNNNPEDNATKNDFEQHIPTIVSAVLEQINRDKVSKNKKHTQKKSVSKRSTKRERIEVSSSSCSGSSSGESSSTESSGTSSVKNFGRSKKNVKKTSGKRIISLSFRMVPAVKLKILQGKYVPLFKFLPGFEAKGQEVAQVLSEDGTI